MYDYNFYLSRIRQGQEKRFLVVEKYYNQPHQGSLFQIFYLFIGKAGLIFGASPTVLYHGARLILGFVFLILISLYVDKLFSGWWRLAAFLLITTSSSWPVLVKAGEFWRFGTYMGWWSAVDSLQRITFIPHVLLGQIGILIFIRKYSAKFSKTKPLAYILWGVSGFLIGIVFPPSLIVVYAYFFLYFILEVGLLFKNQRRSFFSLWREKIIPQAVFVLLSAPALVYARLMFSIYPWKALALFDTLHGVKMPYADYYLALGPVLIFGLLGAILVLIKQKKEYYFSVVWIAAIFLLFKIFEFIPMQSSIRFTEGAINVPLGILAAYFFFTIFHGKFKNKKFVSSILKLTARGTATATIVMGLLVMTSMVFWLTDQVKGKRAGGWKVPSGVQLAYPLKDFMRGISYIQNNTRREEVVLAYDTASNYIPAYAGNFVYIGHANTPDEKEKRERAAEFFSAGMTEKEASDFMKKENISLVFFGPQEKEIKGINDPDKIYSFLSQEYRNDEVVVYRVKF